MSTEPKFRFLVSAYHSDFVRANTEDEAIELFTNALLDIRLSEFTVEVQEQEELK